MVKLFVLLMVIVKWVKTINEIYYENLFSTLSFLLDVDDDDLRNHLMMDQDEKAWSNNLDQTENWNIGNSSSGIIHSYNWQDRLRWLHKGQKAKAKSKWACHGNRDLEGMLSTLS